MSAPRSGTRRVAIASAGGGGRELAAWTPTETTTRNQWCDYDGRVLSWRVFASTGGPQSPARRTRFYQPSGQVQSRRVQGGPTIPLRYTIREQLEPIGNPASTAYPFSVRYAYFPSGTVA